MCHQGVVFEVMQHLMDCGNILSGVVLKSVIKHFIFSVYFNKYAFLHLILLITFDRVHILQKARCYVHQLIESFPVIYNLSRNTKKNLDSDIVDTYLPSRIFSTFLPYRPIFLYYQGDLILELVHTSNKLVLNLT